MNFKNIILTALLSAALSGAAQDRVVLKNGDVLSGKILEQTADHVYFKSTAFGAVALDPRDILEIRITNEELGEISVPADAISTPDTPADSARESQPLQTAQNDPPADPAPGGQPTLEQRPSKEKPQQANKSKKKKSPWSGQSGLAIAMRDKTSTTSSGSSSQDQYETYRFYGNLNWKGERNKLSWNWTYRYSEDEDGIRDDYFNVTQKYNHTFINDNYFAAAKTLYQRDYNREIENEYLQTAELGVKWFGKESKVQLSTSAGGAYHIYDREESDGTFIASVSEPKFIFDGDFRWNIINTLSLTQTYTHLGNLENYHFEYTAGIENKLVKDIFLRLEYKLDRDTEVAYDDKGYYDKALLTSLLYKF